MGIFFNFKFQLIFHPVYDNTVIIGSNYKLRAKIGTNEFETFDSFQR